MKDLGREDGYHELHNIRNLKASTTTTHTTSIAGSAWSLPALAAEHIVDIAWDAKGQFRHEARVVPKKFVEVCGKLAQGTKVG